ncbi:MAG: hypothetical protein ACXVRQ_06240 [Gaiellaceae bacterium]
MNVDQLAPDEPLSPELVLVFPPELRAQALARLDPPAWTTPRRRAVEVPAAAVSEPYAPALRVFLVARVGQLALIFVAVTILILVMSLVASAMR